MRYVEFRDAIRGELKRAKGGRTWVELREGLGLPYERACPEWVKRLEDEIGLKRERVDGRGRGYVWRV